MMSHNRPAAQHWIPWVAVVLVTLGFPLAQTSADETSSGKKPRDPDQSYRIPYQLTDTKHILVRAKINGKGPFHFIIDTGAPALYVSTESCKKHGIQAKKGGWGEFDTFEIEGGLVMEKVKGRIETPFQVSGMNGMNMPGIRIDGMIGYTILAQYRMELDLTKPHMVWTKLPWDPPSPHGLFEGGQAPPEVAIMGGLVTLIKAFVPRRPDPVFVQRGQLGIELAEEKGAVVITKVLAEGAGAQAGLKAGDRVITYQGKEVKSLPELHKLAAEFAADAAIKLGVSRGQDRKEVVVETGKGL